MILCICSKQVVPSQFCLPIRSNRTLCNLNDEDFEAEIDWLDDEIEDIAYVTQVNEMV